MTDLITPTTKIEAVNWSLNACGFTQVSTLEGTVGRDTSIVVTSLDNEVRSLCRKGLWFSRRDVTLTPNEDGYLVLPSGTLSIRRASDLCRVAWAAMDWREQRPTMRQGKVFSIIRQSYVFTQPFTLMLYEALAFEDLPDEARQYAMVVSALDLNRSIVRSDTVTKDLSPMLTSTWSELLNAELENSNHRFI